ncbi:alpha/beta hydrolase [Dyadobacter sp. NIV53]|uniref:alpha/beta hydrolase n=1 Tax=Dyadobacter sp. NIV53 TaxID=2861765 RepID=UPI001C8767E3|nr:alpha/beta hydrolase [Dyadobacter sp. NIV53]
MKTQDETTINGTLGKHLTAADLVEDIAGHPAFKGFGELMLPRDNNSSNYKTSINNISSLLPYHNAVNPDDVVKALNRLIDDANQNKTIYYSFYNEQQKKQDPAKNNTGLFFFRGDPDAPFAIICPGGGFAYVGSLHEGFPLASEISKKKFNAFVIRYRIGSEQWATEDLANAIRFVFENASTLKVNTKDYSLWVGSAGARMVGNIAQYGVNAFVPGNYPKPVTAVISYTGQSSYSKDFPSTFINVSADDGIANVNTVERRVQNLKNAGVTVSYERYKNAGHGFGLGTGTDATGWLNNAVVFWKSQMSR